MTDFIIQLGPGEKRNLMMCREAKSRDVQWMNMRLYYPNGIERIEIMMDIISHYV